MMLDEPHPERNGHRPLSRPDAAGLPAQDGTVYWDLTQRQLCDIELLMNGGFAPLESFLGKADYESVIERSRLADDSVWPIPVMLDLPEKFAGNLDLGTRIGLRDPEGSVIAVMTLKERWKADLALEAERVYGSTDTAHPGVDHLFRKTHGLYASGPLQKIRPPTHYDFQHLRDSPAELRHKFLKWGWTKVVGFQTRNPMHQAHQQITFRAARTVGANLLIQPVVGITKPDDIDPFTRVRCYEHLIRYYPEQTAALSLLPLAMRMAGPREALWHAVIRKNFGCTHFIVGRDHSGPGKDSHGKHFYDPYEAHTVVSKYAAEIGIIPITFREMVYVPSRGIYVEEGEIPRGESYESVSGTELRRRLQEGIDLPPWFTYPEIARELRRSYPPLGKRGFTVFFSGLSGAGKSTIANALRIKLMQIGGRPITLLDGDIVRKHLSSELGFSREHRDLNILRIAFVAGEITKNGGIAICAPIAPFESTRKNAVEMIRENGGGVVMVFVKTPLDVCESRDRKELYARARAGLIPDFTGISSPYEEPLNPDVVVETTTTTPAEAAQTIIQKLEEMGYLR